MTEQRSNSGNHRSDGIGDPLVSRTYREAATEQVPANIDDAILQKARAATAGRAYSKYAGTIFWLRPLAWAATIALSLAIVIQVAVLPQADIESIMADQPESAVESYSTETDAEAAAILELKMSDDHGSPEPQAPESAPARVSSEQSPVGFAGNGAVPTTNSPTAAATPIPELAPSSRAAPAEDLRQNDSQAGLVAAEENAVATYDVAGSQSIATDELATAYEPAEEQIVVTGSRTADADADAFAAADTAMMQEAEAMARMREGRAEAELEEIAVTARRAKSEAQSCSEDEIVEPESWYACIERLENEGLTDEADAQRESLLEEFPDFEIPD